MLEAFDPRSPLPTRPSARRSRLARAVEREATHAELDAALRAHCDRVDSEALADAMTYSLEEEIAFFDYGLSLAGSSAFKQELVKQKVLRINQKNNRRIDRRHP